MYLKVDYEIEPPNGVWPRKLLEALALNLAAAIVEWAEAHQVSANGIIDLMEESDDQNDHD
jgi:hypothetical protein